MARLLITGASGLLGASLAFEAKEGHRVAAQYHRHPFRHEHIHSIQQDLGSKRGVQNLLELAEPEWIVHCAAATSIEACEEDPAWAFRMNADLPAWIAREAKSTGARLVHISTDAVFDGRRGDYKETDRPNPINIYAESKLAGEQAVMEEHPEALVVRTNIYGWNAGPKRSLAEFFLHHLETRKPCRGFDDVTFAPILVNDLAGLILRMLELKLNGLYHVAGRECLSKFEFGVRLAEVFGLDASFITPISVEEAGMRAKRSHKLCLDCSRAVAALGIELPNAEAGLLRFKLLRDHGIPARLKEMAGGVNEPK